MKSLTEYLFCLMILAAIAVFYSLAAKTLIIRAPFRYPRQWLKPRIFPHYIISRRECHSENQSENQYGNDSHKDIGYHNTNQVNSSYAEQ